MKSMNLFCAILVFAFLPVSTAGSETKPSAPKMTAAEIVEKNVAARGGMAGCADNGNEGQNGSRGKPTVVASRSRR